MTDLRVAETILTQLGGGKFVAMTGARAFAGSADSLTFKLPKSPSGIRGVRVTLTPDDLYTVTFYKWTGRVGASDFVPVLEREGVYADQLRDVFTAATGLYTSLGTLGGHRSNPGVQMPGLSMTESDLLQHVQMWGSDGYPVQKLGRKWIVADAFGVKGPPSVYPTKRAATEQFERWIDAMLRKHSNAVVAAQGNPRGRLQLVADVPQHPTRDEAITRIREGLKRRTGHTWSVTGGRGTAWGWIHVATPPSHGPKHGRHRGELSTGERVALSRILGYAPGEGTVGHQGWSIPGSSAYYRDAIKRAERGLSDETPKPYWD